MPYLFSLQPPYPSPQELPKPPFYTHRVQTCKLFPPSLLPVFIRGAFVGGLESFTTSHARVALTFFTLPELATPSGRRQAATTCSGCAGACASHHGGNTFWTSPDRRHDSPLPCAAAAPLFPALPWLSSSSCRRWSLRGLRGKWWKEGLFCPWWF